MQLTDEQRNAVAQWAGEGLNLSDIQKRMAETFGLRLTYMDVRFLVLDLGVKIRDKSAPKTPSPAKHVAPGEGEDEDGGGGAPLGQPAAAEGAGSVRVEVDRVMKAGAVISGTVRFSDGVTAAWFLDQLGRLGLDPGRSGHRPSSQDLAAFQSEIRRVLASRGY